MKKLFEKNEVTFAIVLIVVYVVGASMMGMISEKIGIRYSAETVFAILMSVALFVFIKKNGLMKHLGLCRPEVSAARMWFYLPLILIAARAMLFGVGAEYPPADLAAHTVCMLFVGFVEEVIFRGFLFRGIAKDNETTAIIVSAVTFGVGHIVNLFNGYELFDSVTQIIYAVGCGFMLVFLFIRTGSLLPCIAFHSLNNLLTGFATAEGLVKLVGNERTAELILLAAGFVVMAMYTVYVIKCIPKRELSD